MCLGVMFEGLFLNEKIASAILRLSLPLTLITDIPPLPRGVLICAIVSMLLVYHKYLSLKTSYFDFHKFSWIVKNLR